MGNIGQLSSAGSGRTVRHEEEPGRQTNQATGEPAPDWLALPDELWLRVFGFLATAAPQSMLACVPAVCRTLRRLADDASCTRQAIGALLPAAALPPTLPTTAADLRALGESLALTPSRLRARPCRYVAKTLSLCPEDTAPTVLCFRTGHELFGIDVDEPLNWTEGGWEPNAATASITSAIQQGDHVMLAAGNQLVVLDGHLGHVATLSGVPDGTLAARADGGLLAAANHNRIVTWHKPEGDDWSGDPRTLLSRCEVSLGDQIRCDGIAIPACAAGMVLAVGSSAEKLLELQVDPPRGVLVRRRLHGNVKAMCIGAVPGSNQVILGMQTGEVRLLPLADGPTPSLARALLHARVLGAHDAPVLAVATSPGGQHAVSVDSRGEARLWNLGAETSAGAGTVEAAEAEVEAETRTGHVLVPAWCHAPDELYDVGVTFSGDGTKVAIAVPGGARVFDFRPPELPGCDAFRKRVHALQGEG